MVQNHHNTKVVKEKFFNSVNRTISDSEKEEYIKKIDEKIDFLSKTEIIRTFLKENGMTEVVINKFAKSFYNNPDIASEFEYYIKTSKFIEENPINESGYTAKRLYEEYKNKLSIVGVFSMLITLRETPERGLKIISDNFPTK